MCMFCNPLTYEILNSFPTLDFTFGLIVTLELTSWAHITMTLGEFAYQILLINWHQSQTWTIAFYIQDNIVAYVSFCNSSLHTTQLTRDRWYVDWYCTLLWNNLRVSSSVAMSRHYRSQRQEILIKLTKKIK